MTDTPALSDPRLDALPHRVVRHGQVRSLTEAAEARGVSPAQVIKTMVIRRADDDDYIFVLVPGDRSISWPKLRRHLGVNRVSMPDADQALAVTGYHPGTITPFGASTAWPVLADASMTGNGSIGGGAHGVSLTVETASLIAVLGADSADVTEPV